LPVKATGATLSVKTKTMESPSQIIYGLGSFILACLGMLALCNVLARLSLFESYPNFIGYAMPCIFFLMWWASYFWLIERDKEKREKSENNK